MSPIYIICILIFLIVGFFIYLNYTENDEKTADVLNNKQETSINYDLDEDLVEEYETKKKE
jgi:amino acid permease